MLLIADVTVLWSPDCSLGKQVVDFTTFVASDYL